VGQAKHRPSFQDRHGPFFNPVAVIMRAEAVSRKARHIGGIAFSRRVTHRLVRVIMKFGLPDD
jgi:hypothetical protein